MRRTCSFPQSSATQHHSIAETRIVGHSSWRVQLLIEMDADGIKVLDPVKLSLVLVFAAKYLKKVDLVLKMPRAGPFTMMTRL